MNLPVVSAAEMRAAEEAAFARGITAEALMDEAGAGIAKTVQRFVPAPGQCLVFAGKGNNAGDAIVAAQHLQAEGWQIRLHCAFEESAGSELMRKKLQLFRNAPQNSSSASGATIVIDGLLGVGAKPPLREPVLTACREINRLRLSENARVFSVDLPSGLDADSGAADRDCVIADCTVTIGFAKAGIVADGALDFVGRLEVIPLQDLPIAPQAQQSIMATSASLRALLPRRKFGAYKNQFGRVGVVAGSEGLTGAAALCAAAALHGGAGLVELFVPREIYAIVAAVAPPEVMVRPIGSYRDLLKEKIDVWAIGPGLGREHADEIFELVERLEGPSVIDADALSIIARDSEVLRRCAGSRLLTPHPGEMKRLFPSAPDGRAETARAFCARYPVALLLKGSRTIVHQESQPLSYNPTGTPAMATGGMGDVLTGVCAALIGQQLTPYDAARVGAWLCGRAAELALIDGCASEESLLPTDVLSHLGRAFNDLRTAESTSQG